MATVTRTFERQPSNSKCPGASRHLSIGEDVRFRLGVAEVPAGPATIKMAADWAIGRRMERRSIEIRVVVTGDPADEVRGILDGGNQQIAILFHGVRRA